MGNIQHIDVDEITRFQEELKQLGFDGQSEMMKRAYAILAKAMRKAKKDAVQQVGGQIPNNQRHAEKAVRAKAYSRRSEVLGGHISLLRSRRNGDKEAKREVPPLKNGGKREWSPRTKQMWEYQGTDAQFLLYWLSEGTDERQAGVGRRGRDGKYGNKSTSASRQKYFNGTHNVGKIGAGQIKPELMKILERVVNGEVIPELDKLWAEMAR